MAELIHTSTTYVIQADRGRHEWHDRRDASDEEHIGRSNMHHIHSDSPIENHRLIRRITFDYEVASIPRTEFCQECSPQEIFTEWLCEHGLVFRRKQ